MDIQKDRNQLQARNSGQLFKGQSNVQGNTNDRQRTNQQMFSASKVQSVDAEHVSNPNVSEKKPVLQRGFDYIVRKSEKLTTALYLVTDIMSEREPLKWKVREIGVELLSDIAMTATLRPSEKMSMLRNVMKKTEKTIAFLDVAQSARLMSEMNASMLKKEYLALKDNIEGEWSNVYEKSKSIFSDAFFDVPRELGETHNSDTSSKDVVAAKVGSFSVPIQPQSHAVDVPNAVPHQPFHTATPTAQTSSGVQPSSVTVKLPPAAPLDTPQPVTSVVEKQIVAPGQDAQGHSGGFVGAKSTVTMPPARTALPSPVAPTDRLLALGTGVLLQQGRMENDRNDRRKIILALVKQKPSLTVRDIAKSIPQVSEKTIQRELLAMVGENVLVKRGERRWSTYSLRTNQ